jgi:hypothetical protein
LRRPLAERQRAALPGVKLTRLLAKFLLEDDMISKEDYERIVTDVMSRLSESMDKQLAFERERADQADKKEEGRIWIAFYCHFTSFPNMNRHDIAKHADGALLEYKERFATR